MIHIDLSNITGRSSVRDINPYGVEALKTKIENVGFLPEKPLLVTSDGNGGYILIDGAHRVEALLSLGKTEAPAVVDNSLITNVMRLQRARQANDITAVLIHHTWVDDAKLVWKLMGEDMQHAEIATILNVGLDAIKKYSALNKICEEAWNIIVPTFGINGTYDNDSDGTSEVPPGTCEVPTFTVMGTDGPDEMGTSEVPMGTTLFSPKESFREIVTSGHIGVTIVIIIAHVTIL